MKEPGRKAVGGSEDNVNEGQWQAQLWRILTSLIADTFLG
jgi:hypothetical protein